MRCQICSNNVKPTCLPPAENVKKMRKIKLQIIEDLYCNN